MFLAVCQRLTPKELEEFMGLVLSLQEKEEIDGRMHIIRELLLELHTQREMSDALSVSIAKITRGSNALKTISPNLKNTLRKILK